MAKKMAKKVATAVEDTSLEGLLAKANKKFGVGSVMCASKARGMVIPRIETGIFSVDYASGGGIPVGRITGIYGKKSSAKTTLALKIVASAQHYCALHLVKMEPTKKKLFRCLSCGLRHDKDGQCPDCKDAGYESLLVDAGDVEMKCPICKKYNPFKTVWMDAEGVWSNQWSASMGINCRHVYIIRTESAEQAIDIADLIIRSNKCNLLVIDTLAHLIPSTEIEESSEKWQMGLQARLSNKLFRKLVSAQNAQGVNTEVRPTIMILNQVRVKLGVMFGDPETRPGGMGQEFASSLEIKMWPGKYEQDEIGNTMSLLGNFKCTKNKCSVPQQGGNFRLWLRQYENQPCGSTEEFQVVMGIALDQKLFGEDAANLAWKGEVLGRKAAVVQYFFQNRQQFVELRETLMRNPFLGQIVSDKSALKDMPDDERDSDDEIVEGGDAESPAVNEPSTIGDLLKAQDEE